MGVFDDMRRRIFPKQLDFYKMVDKYMPLKTALIIAGIYTVLGVCWIIFSDRVLAMWAADKEFYVFLSSIKGVIYVSASALVIFFMVYNAFRVINETNNIMKSNYDELENINKRLAESEDFSKAIINKMLNAYALHRILLDENGKPYDYEFIDVNPSFEKFTGISKEEIIGKRYKEIIKGIEEETNWIDVYGKVAITGEPVSFESYTSYFDKWVVVSAYSPGKEYFITVFSDISDLKRNEAELRKNAYHDSLTELPNRLALFEDFGRHISTFPEKNIALFFIDSDNFKFINDTMGHSIGDILIKKMGEKLTSLFEEGHNNICRVFTRLN